MDRPKTRYVRSGEIAIAYQVHGSGAYDLLLNHGTGSNIETVWGLPEAVRLFERLGRFARVIRYDRRDSGLSDPIKDDLTLEAHAEDALAVMDAVGAESPVLMGGLDGARSLALLAATHPTRVGGLIAFAATARGVAANAPEFAETAAQGIADLANWPDPLLPLYAPGWLDDPGRSDRLRRYIQTSVAPRQAARLLRMSLISDISKVLPLVQAPTLVLRPRDLEVVQADAVREFATLIPSAEYREMPGDAQFIFALDIDVVADIIEEFVTGTSPAPPTTRILATVLFTDLVDSTRRAAQLGDRAWAEILGRHLAQARTAVSSHGGETMKTTGDGILAVFTGPAQSVRCAERIASDARHLGLGIRAGVHTGEVERTADDVSGIAVHLAARIMSLAKADEILVSRTVRDLVIGSELAFSDHGEHKLKGIPDRWMVYAAGT